MKKFRKLKNKIILCLLALVLPVCAMGIILMQTPALAFADTSYLTSYREEQSFANRNNNFSSGVTNFSLNDSFTGWNSKNPNGGKATSGVITTGSRFQDYGSNRFYLNNNPKTVDSDQYVLMINSKHSKSVVGEETNKGYYTQDSISLDANSYYYFQVAYSTDTNYSEHTEYDEHQRLTVNDSITPAQFGYNEDGGATVGFDTYLRYTPPTELHLSGNYYIYKGLDKTDEKTTYVENVTKFYQDDEYYGILLEETTEDSGEPVTKQRPVYVILEALGTSNGNYYLKEGYDIYTCSINYNPETKQYDLIAEGLETEQQPWLYTPKTVPENENYPVIGSMYVDGLKDADGKAVPCEFVSVRAKNWTTFYFFIATGSEAQSVNLELWLGSKTATSSGVVFYDACHLYRCSENYFWNTYNDYLLTKKYTETSVPKEGGQATTTTTSCVTLADLRQDKTLDFGSRNFDFEKGNLTENWIVDEHGFGGAAIYDSSSAYEVLKDNYVGTNLSKHVVWDENEKKYVTTENTHLLGLSAKDNYSKITTRTPIDIDVNEVYKIKIYYKASSIKNGSAYVSLSEDENRILDFYSDLKDNYTYATEVFSSGISSNTTNKYTNDYSVLEFYVKGGPLFKSAVNLSLSLGKAKSGDAEAENATGYIFFDDITIEKATTSEYDSATNKIELGTNTKTADNGITNGSFDDVSTTTNGIPTPNSWTVKRNENSNNSFFGVVNTDTKIWEGYKAKYKENTSLGNKNPYEWTTYVSNPGATSIRKSKTNNVLMLANINRDYQAASSTTLTLATGYKVISFDCYISDSTTLDLDLISTNGEFSIFNKKIAGKSAWEHIEVIVNVENSTEIYVKLTLGKNTTTEKVAGYAFFDNFALQDSSITDEDFEALNPKDKADLSNFYYNIQTSKEATSIGDVNGSNHPAYVGTPTASSDQTSGMKGGLVKGEAFRDRTDFYKAYMDDEYFFYITVPNGGSYTIDSNYSLDLDSSNYYKLSFKLKTHFTYQTTEEGKDKDKTYHYGATVGLTGFDYMTEIETTEDGLTEYSIYLHPSETTTAKLHIALVCDTYETSGNLVLCDLFLDSSISQADYEKIEKETSKSGYNGNSFVAKASGSDEENPDDGNDSDSETDTNTTPASNGEGFNWLLIPSLITALAIVIAVVGFILRKIKIGKIEKKRKETYDRKGSIKIDVIKKAAKEEQNKEIAAKTEEIAKFEAELERIEKEHKQKVVSLRAKDKGKVSKSTDKEFKIFAQKRTVIAEKIESLKKQKEELATPEHLLSLERKFYAQEEMKQRELEKASAKINKEREKKQTEKAEEATKTEQSSKKKKK